MASSDADDRSDRVIPPKPPRPFTEYHVFFQLERNYILQHDDSKSGDGDGGGGVDTTADFEDVDPHSASRPPRYRSLILPRGWHTKGSRPKRRSRRRTHGRVSFVDLTKRISRRWKEADVVTRDYCRDVARGELRRYREEMKDYVERYGEGAGRAAGKRPDERGGEEKAGGSNRGRGRGRKRGGGEEEEKEKRNTAAPEEDILAQENLNLLLRNQAAMLAACRGRGTSSASSFRSKREEELLVQENLNLFLKNQAAMLAASRGPIMPVAAAPWSNVTAPDAFSLFCEQQRQALMQQQQQFVDYRNLLAGTTQPRAQAVDQYQQQPESMVPQVNVNHIAKPQVDMNLHGAMDSRQSHDHGDWNGGRKIATLTTVKDQGKLPPLFENEEYQDQTTEDYDYNNFFAGGRLDDDFNPFDGNADDTPAGPFEDHSIAGPIGLCLESPAVSPCSLKTSPAWNEWPVGPAAPRLPFGDAGDGIVDGNAGEAPGRAKSISPVPEYNIAPEISFLAKNFVNEFSRYLDHDHEVQRAELDAIDADNDRGGTTDRPETEGRAPGGMRKDPPERGVGGAARGKGARGGATKGSPPEEPRPVGERTSPRCLPVEGREPGPTPLAKRGREGAPYARREPAKRSKWQRPTVPSRALPEVGEADEQRRGGPSPVDFMSPNVSRENIEAWLRDVLA